MPSLSQEYPIATLPRSSTTGAPRALVSPLASADPLTLHLGVSGHMVGEYVTQPTPQLAWLHLLPPSVAVTALCVVDQTAVVGTTNKKKNQLLVVRREGAPTEVDVEASIVGIHHLSGSFVCVDALGGVSRYTASGEAVYRTTALDTKVLFHSIDSHLLLVVEESGRKNSKRVSARLVDPSNGSVITTHVLDNTAVSSCFAASAGQLYTLDAGVVSTYSLPSFALLRRNQYSQFGSEPSMVSPLKDRLVIALGTTVYLVNDRFEAVVGQVTLKHPHTMLTTFEVDGNLLRLCNTIALALKHKTDAAQVVAIPIDTGVGSLYESLGKRELKPVPLSGLPPLTSDALSDASREQAAEADAILAHLAKNKKNTVWNGSVVPYLKGGPWAPSSKSSAAAVYDAAKDRVVDPAFVYRLVEMILGDVDAPAAGSKFLPATVLGYLLTHPLFPSAYAGGVLVALKDQPKLLRQAIVATQGLPCAALVAVLADTQGEAFVDAATRLGKSFPLEEITAVVQATEAFPLEAVVRRAAAESAWEVVPALVDAGGLFGWSSDLVGEVLAKVNTRADLLEVVAMNNSIAAVALGSLTEPIVRRKSKVVNVESELRRDKLESMLGWSRQRDLEQIPAYSVERIV